MEDKGFDVLEDYANIPDDIEKGQWWRLKDYSAKDPHITFRECRNAVRHNGRALEFVPKRFRTEKLCELAVRSNPLAFQHVPIKYKTGKMINLALENEETRPIIIKFIPNNYLTPNLVKNALLHSFDYGILATLPPRVFSKELVDNFMEKTEGISLLAQLDVLKACPKDLRDELDLTPLYRAARKQKDNWVYDNIVKYDLLSETKLAEFAASQKKQKKGAKTKEEKAEIEKFEAENPKINFSLNITSALTELGIHGPKY